MSLWRWSWIRIPLSFSIPVSVLFFIWLFSVCSRGLRLTVRFTQPIFLSPQLCQWSPQKLIINKYSLVCFLTFAKFVSENVNFDLEWSYGKFHVFSFNFSCFEYVLWFQLYFSLQIFCKCKSRLRFLIAVSKTSRVTFLCTSKPTGKTLVPE